MNLVEKAVNNGGKLAPLVIPDAIGAMNPSVYIDDDGDILVNVRVVNYTLYHSENKQRFPSRWGPLSYLHPEKDQRLVTENYLCRLDGNLKVINSTKVEYLNLHTPRWEFVGEEDCRVVRWDGKLYLIGVRRDVDTIGTGRMEMSEIELDKDNWTAKEISRARLEVPSQSYCEKNYAPILDKPNHFIKWHSPVELVKAVGDSIEQVSVKQGATTEKDQRGGSQLVRWGNHYISISHEVDLFKNYLMQKDAIYRHRLCLWDDQLNLVGLSKPFSFLDFPIEFCVGAAVFGENLLVSFSISDNAAFILSLTKSVVEDLILEALD